MPRPVTSNNPGDSFYVSPSDFDTKYKNIAPFVDAGYYWSGQQDQHQAINFFPENLHFNINPPQHPSLSLVKYRSGRRWAKC